MVFNPKMWLVRYFDGLYQEILENRFIHWRIYESSQETCTYHMESGSGAILQAVLKMDPLHTFFLMQNTKIVGPCRTLQADKESKDG
jgi:hypothetical protein